MTAAMRDEAKLLSRLEPHVARWAPARKGKERRAAFRHARALLGEFKAPTPLALRYLSQWNERNPEPLAADELRGILDKVGREKAEDASPGPHNRYVSKEEDAPEIISRSAAEIKIEPVEWLWNPYIPLGTYSILEGPPNVGKTYFACWLASALSLGTGLPGCPDFQPVKSLLIVSEDDSPRTIVPRLVQQGADVNMVRTIDCDADGPLFNLGTDAGIEHLEAEIEKAEARFVFLDPILTFIGRTDSYKDSEVRSFLRPLCQVASRHGCALVAARHLNKAEGVNPANRGTGSVAWWSRARSGFLMGKNRDPEPRFALVHTKFNLSPQGPTLEYRLDPEDGFVWIPGRCDISAGELLAEPTAPDAEDKSELARAVEFLHERLADGPLESTVILAEAKAEGIAPRTLSRAKRAAGMKPKKIGSGHWELSLPNPEPPASGGDD